MKKQIVLLSLLVAALVAYFLLVKKNNPSRRKLPVFYAEEAQKTIENGKEITDTVYHTIPDFKFLDQDGDTVTQERFKNAIYVTDYFFTTCPSICPKMMSQMVRVRDAEKNRNDFLILSHSVNPDNDSVAVLKKYADLLHADSKRWMLVTGRKKDIYDIAMDGYKLPLSEDPRVPGGFLHSSLFVLVDKEKRIRGYYDGTDSLEVNKLLKDIDLLYSEYVHSSPN